MKKSTKHMQFIRISLLIFALGFFFACSLGTQRYGKLSLSIEVPDYLKTEPNEQPSNARFIHPDGEKLEFQLFVRDELFFEQTIPLNPESNSPQKVSISVDKVPYNVPLYAKITVYGEVAPDYETPPILGQNTIDIGRLRYPNRKLTLGVKPVNGANVAYQYQVQQGINLFEYFETPPDTFNIEMFPKKGLYTFCVYGSNVSPYDSAYIYLYDSDGKKYQNSIDSLDSRVRVFYHPENEVSTYYAYVNLQEPLSVSGEKLEQDILILMYDDDDMNGDMDGDVIVNSEEHIDFGQLDQETLSKEITFTIYNPYPFTLNPNYSSKGESLEDFTFKDFPNAILPGKSKEFTVIFETKEPSVSVPITISANGLESFVMNFTGTFSQ